MFWKKNKRALFSYLNSCICSWCEAFQSLVKRACTPPPLVPLCVHQISTYTLLSPLLILVISVTVPRPLTIQQLKEKYNVNNEQLTSEIQKNDIPYLAQYFDKIEYYLHLLNLTEAEKTDVQNENRTQIAMINCLLFWRGHNPSEATYLSLLNILLRLRKGEIACNVCQYVAEHIIGKYLLELSVLAIACIAIKLYCLYNYIYQEPHVCQYTSSIYTF